MRGEAQSCVGDCCNASDAVSVEKSEYTELCEESGAVERKAGVTDKDYDARD